MNIQQWIASQPKHGDESLIGVTAESIEKLLAERESLLRDKARLDELISVAIHHGEVTLTSPKEKDDSWDICAFERLDNDVPSIFFSGRTPRAAIDKIINTHQNKSPLPQLKTK